MVSFIKNTRKTNIKNYYPYLAIGNDYCREIIIERNEEKVKEKIKSFYKFLSKIK